MTSNIGGDKEGEFNFVQGVFPSENNVNSEGHINKKEVNVDVVFEPEAGYNQPSDGVGAGNGGASETPKTPKDLKMDSFFGEEVDTAGELPKDLGHSGVESNNIHTLPEISESNDIEGIRPGGILDLGSKKITAMGGVEHIDVEPANTLEGGIDSTLSGSKDIITPGEEDVDNNIEVRGEGGKKEGMEKGVESTEGGQKNIILSEEDKKRIEEIDELLASKEMILKGLEEGGRRVGGAIDILGGGDVTVLKNETEDVNAQILKLKEEKDNIMENASNGDNGGIKIERINQSTVGIAMHEGIEVIKALNDAVSVLDDKLTTEENSRLVADAYSMFIDTTMNKLRVAGVDSNVAVTEFRQMFKKLTTDGMVLVTMNDDGKVNLETVLVGAMIERLSKSEVNEAQGSINVPGDLTDGVADDYSHQEAA